ncbi:peptidase S9 [Microbacterium sp. Root61]|uniref:serine hydrolase n=1 Tax=Microbacterium sp. Root61 TaxID=1736570 RepID=UPI0006FCDC43|nr:serine hydrolase [Microbacterium sp. Root61]KRA24201.1 peptidase S9 [Microbacterium sp. Root61]
MTNRSIELADLARIAVPAETAISPDGLIVVFSRTEVVDGAPASSLWSVATVGEPAEPRRLTSGPADAAPEFSRDGRSLLFTREVDGVAQLHLLPIDGGEPRVVTAASDFPLGVSLGRLSPDATRVVVAAPVSRDSDTPAADTPLVIDRLGFKADGVGWFGSVRRHLFVVDLATGANRRLTDGDWHAGPPSWSPDGRLVAFTASSEPRSDVDLTSCAYVVEADAKIPVPVSVGQARSVSGPIAWAPDGAALIAVGSAVPRVGNAALLRLALDPATADVDLAAGLDRNVMVGAPAYPGGAPAFTADGAEIVFCLRERGWTHLHAVSADGSQTRALMADAHAAVSALSVAAAAPRASVVVRTPESFGEVAVVDLTTGEMTVLTSVTATALPDVDLFTAQEREFSLSDGTRVHGWLLSAPDTTGAAPLLLDIHGGPHNAWTGLADDIHLYHQVLAARGWRILMVNPRGSDGYGDDFFRAVNGGWGAADEKDFLEPVDQLIAEGLADPERLALTGYSYGGFSTCALTASTDRFSAAVAGGLICNFTSMAAEGEGPAYFSEMAADVAPVGHYATLLEASPISRVQNVTTPTLVLHGAADDTCPVGQAQEWFSALRVQGVPTRLVVYPGGSHLVILQGPLAQRIDYNSRLVEWVERYTVTKAAAAGLVAAGQGEAFWRKRLDALRTRYGVTGAQFGIVRLGEDGTPFERTTASSGVLDVTTGVSTHDDALFQLGSITKVWTSILIMQLVDEGALDLDTPVRAILPDFAVQDESVAAAVTVRHLLSHTSGIDGDLFTDTGRGDDCVEKYVATLTTAEQVHPLGERFSYCNSGFVVAGRIIEVLRGMSWDDALKKYIVTPMGLTHTITLTEDAPRFGVATGHGGFGAEAEAVPVWPIARSMGPAGLIAARMGDLLTFAETALRGGVAPNGMRILSEASAAAMLEEQISLREAVPTVTGWGLGWFLEDWNGTFAFGHDGGTIGQRAYLRIFPEHGFAVGLLTSGGQSDGLYREMFDDAASAAAGVHIPAPFRDAPSPEAAAPEPTEYASGGIVVTLAHGEDGPQLTMTERTDILRLGAEPESTTVGLVPANAAGVWAYTSPDMAGWGQYRPVPGGIYLGYRYVPRVAAEA